MSDPFDLFMEEDLDDEEEENTVVFSYIPIIDDDIAEPSNEYEDFEDEANDIDF